MSIKLVIPCAGKLIKTRLALNNRAVCFVLNKGYLECSSLELLLLALSDIEDSESIMIVGSTDKINKGNNIVYYRQRIFFKSLKDIILYCKNFGVVLEVSKDFSISINNIINCKDDLVYMERYAYKFNESIDTWLTNVCLIQLYNMCSYYGLNDVILNNDIKEVLKTKVGYLDRAPFLVSEYNLDLKRTSIFLDLSINDLRQYSDIPIRKDKVGYTFMNVKRDKKLGVLI